MLFSLSHMQGICHASSLYVWASLPNSPTQFYFLRGESGHAVHIFLAQWLPWSPFEYLPYQWITGHVW